MAADKKYRNKTLMPINVESDRLKEFDEMCWRLRTTRTDKINEMIVRELEKNQVGSTTPINIDYKEENKNPSINWRQLSLFEKLPRTEAIEIVSRLDNNQLEKIEFSNQSIAQAIYLRKNKKFTKVYKHGMGTN